MPSSLRAAALAALIALTTPAAAQDEYILFLEYETSTRNLDGTGSGSSSGRQALVERVLAETDSGTEIVYGLDTPQDEVRGNAMWMYPARVLVAPDGTKSVLDPEKVAERLADFLDLGGWTRDVCGQWTFTWTAIQIRCDEQAIIESIETYGMRPGKVHEGAQLMVVGAEGKVLLGKIGERDGRIILSGKASVDAEFARLQQAKSDVVVAGFSGEEVTQEDALAALANFRAIGTITVELEVDPTGLVWKRTDTTDITVTGAKYGDERRTGTTTVERLTRAQWDARFTANP